MNIYKIIFAKNEVIACNNVGNNINLNALYHFEQDKGQLIYALIKAEKEEEALRTAKRIVEENTRNIWGNNHASS